MNSFRQAATLGYLLTLVIAAPACHSIKPVNHINRTAARENSYSRVLVIGDIQQKDELLLRDNPSFGQATWDSHEIDTTNLKQLDPQSLLASFAPDDILQLGDFVDLNNALEIYVPLDNKTSISLKPRYDEWKRVLRFFQTTGPIYPTIGNHETYKRIRFHGARNSNGLFTITAGPNPKTGDIEFNNDEERHAVLINHFPHLKKTATFFKSFSGTYFAIRENYCLLSIDGAALVSKNPDPARASWIELKTFIEESLTKCSSRDNDAWTPLKPSIVTIHYPIFSALAVGEEEFLDETALKVTEIFNTFRVALVLSGHEHLYMRYGNEGLRSARYSSFLPLHSTYVTIANFGVPKGKDAEKLRGIGKNEKRPTRVSFQPPHTLGSSPVGNRSAFVLAEKPTVGFLEISNHTIKFVAKTKIGSNWDISDSFDLTLTKDGTWQQTNGTLR